VIWLETIREYRTSVVLEILKDVGGRMLRQADKILNLDTVRVSEKQKILSLFCINETIIIQIIERQKYLKLFILQTFSQRKI
jgi:hypothetical protein